MSDTYDNPRDRRKLAQQQLASAAYHSGVTQQVTMGALYQSEGRSGMTTADKVDSIRGMREAVKVALINAGSTVEALTVALENLDKALGMYSQQATQESSLDAVGTPEDLFKMIDSKPES